MLDVMRRQSFLIYSVFGAIILILAVNFGPGSGGCSRQVVGRSWAAKVNGEAIPQEEFASQLGQQVELQRRRAEQRGMPVDAVALERMGIRRFVLDQMVQQRLMAQEAARRGVQVSDDELLAVLRGHYGVRNVSYQTYEDFVANTFGTTVVRFEEMVRREQAIGRLVRVVDDGIDVGEPALKHAYLREHDRARIDYVRIPVDVEGVPQPSPEAVETLLTAEPKALQDYYDSHAEAFQTPEQAELRQIVRHLAADANEAAVVEAQNVLLAARQKLIEGGDFVALAKELSDDRAAAENGGNMGYLARRDVAPAIAQAVFDHDVNALAGPIRTPQGLHLVLKTGSRPAGVQPLEEVRRQVAAAVLRERVAASKAENAAEKLRRALADGAAWDKVARHEGDETLQLGGKKAERDRKTALPVRQTSGWIRRSDEELPRIGRAPDMQRAIFALQKPTAKTPTAHVAPRVFRVEDGVYVMALQDRETPDLAKFAEERELLQDEALASKRRRVVAAWLAHLTRQAKIDINPASITPVLPASAAEEGQS